MRTGTIEDLRIRYQNSVLRAPSANAFWDDLKGYDGKQGIMLAYKASALALKANHDWNPYNKLNWLKDAMSIFAEAVKEEPSNIEIRFLRFATQHNTPEFLNQSRQLDLDKAVFLENLNNYKDYSLDTEQLMTFYKFFVESKRFSTEELRLIKDFISQTT